MKTCITDEVGQNGGHNKRHSLQGRETRLEYGASSAGDDGVTTAMP